MQQALQLKASQIPQLLCKQNNSALLFCRNPKCLNISGIMCYKKNCQCKIGHQKCISLLVQPLLSQMRQSIRQMDEDDLQSYNTIQKIIDSLIQKLSQIKNDMFTMKQASGLRKSSSLIYSLLISNQTQKINGELIAKVQEQLNKQQKFTIMHSKFINQYWTNQQKKFDQICKCLRNYFERDFKNDSKCSRISNITNDFKLLENWLRPSFNNSQIKFFQLLYRASQNNHKIQKFHQKVYNHENTLVLAKTEFGKIIGGFTPFKWNHVSQAYVIDVQKKSFLFSLTEKEKIPLQGNGDYAIFCGQKFGPNFGGCTFAIQDNSKGNCSNYSGYYMSEKFPKSSLAWDRFCGATNGRSFQITEWQVYQVIPQDSNKLNKINVQETNKAISVKDKWANTFNKNYNEDNKNKFNQAINYFGDYIRQTKYQRMNNRERVNQNINQINDQSQSQQQYVQSNKNQQ